ncbi:MAG: helix-turn-helix domain-containing protein [Candidatus Thiodiazotropha endolucinida]|nr:helix-turn-helix domain-containing protein [Candidatus Thiodiazotropha taylori]MCW4225224.1 helix-turn-helix domain-containing protein [Candidatus Thiodiazotropha endolucinida]MCG7880776.1 helix-turn-helix domain-containing protein [Candidatus Thiodiazotropha taylori]MCG7886795.1 helix-turn-helix domain-containing protein [Candidatus Thiodiazotropha taylori]MCG8028182.1 helix-turn-helix domain-containing protein [Candidatus Thiodiazotropha taylori]
MVVVNSPLSKEEKITQLAKSIKNFQSELDSRRLSIASSFSERLNHVFSLAFPEFSTGRGTKLAKIINVSPATTSRWLNGHQLPSPRHLQTLSFLLINGNENVRKIHPEINQNMLEQWLVYGNDIWAFKGPLFPTNGQEKQAEPEHLPESPGDISQMIVNYLEKNSLNYKDFNISHFIEVINVVTTHINSGSTQDATHFMESFLNALTKILKQPK